MFLIRRGLLLRELWHADMPEDESSRKVAQSSANHYVQGQSIEIAIKGIASTRGCKTDLISNQDWIYLRKVLLIDKRLLFSFNAYDVKL